MATRLQLRQLRIKARALLASGEAVDVVAETCNRSVAWVRLVMRSELLATVPVYQTLAVLAQLRRRKRQPTISRATGINASTVVEIRTHARALGLLS